MERISKAENCAPSDAQVVYVRDSQSTGVATSRIKDQAMSSASAFCGAKGLAIFLTSSVPSGKGRAKVVGPKEAGAKGDEARLLQPGPEDCPSAPKQDAGTSKLPAAPSSVEEYADNAKVKALLAEDYVSLMKLGAGVPGRYTDVCFFGVRQPFTTEALSICLHKHVCGNACACATVRKLPGSMTLMTFSTRLALSHNALGPANLKECQRAS